VHAELMEKFLGRTGRDIRLPPADKLRLGFEALGIRFFLLLAQNASFKLAERLPLAKG